MLSESRDAVNPAVPGGEKGSGGARAQLCRAGLGPFQGAEAGWKQAEKLAARFFLLPGITYSAGLRHSGVDSHFGQNPPVQDDPENDDADEKTNAKVHEQILFGVKTPAAKRFR
jgi:hypothetical protein